MRHRDLLDVPGADLPWLRKILTTPLMLEFPPLTVSAVADVRRRAVIQIEHGVLPVRRGRAVLRRLDKIEAEIRASEDGWSWPRPIPSSA